MTLYSGRPMITALLSLRTAIDVAASGNNFAFVPAASISLLTVAVATTSPHIADVTADRR